MTIDDLWTQLMPLHFAIFSLLAISQLTSKPLIVVVTSAAAGPFETVTDVSTSFTLTP